MGGLKIRIEADYNRASLEQARADIERLLEGLPNAPASGDESRLGDAAQVKIDALWRRLGENTRAFLSTAAERFPAGSWFTFQEVADAMRVDVKTVKSWHRNMSRSLKRVEDELGPEPRILEQRWTGERNEYSFTAAVQNAIRDQLPTELVDDGA